MLRAIEDRWQDFRRALRRRDQSRFDRLFTYARNHANASAFLNHRNPLISILVSIDLAQERRLDEHDDRLDDLENTVADLSEGNDSIDHDEREESPASPDD